MIKRIGLIFILVFSLFLVTGCDEETVSVESLYLGGENGLVAEFEPIGIKEDGEYTIYQDEFLPISVLFKNKGEEEIAKDDLSVELKGILVSDFSGTREDKIKNNVEIDKISDLNPEGGDLIIDFTPDGGAKYLLPIDSAYIPLNLLIVYTYRYKTKSVVPDVCFKENIRDEELCDVKESKKVYSSGAPVQVVSAQEDVAGAGKVALMFDIENKGTGDVTLPGIDFNPSYDQVAYLIEPAEERDKWKCTATGGGNKARLTNGKATIRCVLKESLPDGALYTKQIGLTLDYQYRDTISETVRIKKNI